MTCNKHNHDESDDAHRMQITTLSQPASCFVIATPGTWRYLLGKFEPNLSEYVEWSCYFMLGNRNDINIEDK